MRSRLNWEELSVCDFSLLLFMGSNLCEFSYLLENSEDEDQRDEFLKSKGWRENQFGFKTSSINRINTFYQRILSVRYKII